MVPKQGLACLPPSRPPGGDAKERAPAGGSSSGAKVWPRLGGSPGAKLVGLVAAQRGNHGLRLVNAIGVVDRDLICWRIEAAGTARAAPAPQPGANAGAGFDLTTLADFAEQQHHRDQE